MYFFYTIFEGGIYLRGTISLIKSQGLSSVYEPGNAF